MLHKNLLKSGRLGRSTGRRPGWLSLFFVVVGLVAVSVSGTFTVNAQDAPNAMLDIILPYNSTTTLEQSPYNLEVVFTSEISGPLTLEVTNGLPSGAIFSASSGSRRITGTMSWTPSEEQGGQDYVVRFKGTVDMGLAGKASTERKLTITVRERNTHPQITPVEPITVNEDNAANINELAKFTASATDTDEPKQTLTFSSPDLPSGATLNPKTGEFLWSPTEEQGGKDYYLQISVRDNGSPALHWQEGVKITVNEFNEAPVFNTLTAVRSVYEANSSNLDPTTVTVTVSATDSDKPEQTLTYSASNLPDGATFNPTSREFNWSPSESHGGADYTIEFKVTDSGESQRSTTQDVIIRVHDVNDLPEWEIVPAKWVNEDNAANINETVSFTVKANDADYPPQELTYRASNLPDGATFDPTTMKFSWSPSEMQGGDVYPVRFTVIERDGMGIRLVSQTIDIVVVEVNDPPKWAVVPAKTVNEDNTANNNETVSFTVSATDDDLPKQKLTYSAANLPDGARFDAVDRLFSWSPSEAQQGVYDVKFIVIDEAAPLARDSVVQTVQITVNEVNEKPQITTIEDKTLDEGGLLTFVVEANDSDQPAQTLSYSAENLPSGATFDAVSRQFSWQTTEDEGDTIHDVTFIVSDGTVTASETITITVNEVNNAPVLAHLPDVVGHPGQVFFMTISATDSDHPAQTLTYSMYGALEGMWLDSATGEFSWTITDEAIFVPYGVTFTATDDGEPQQSASQMVGFSIQEENLLKNPGFQEAGKAAKQAKNWKGIGLLPSDKRVCKPSSETVPELAEEICEFQFSATPAKAKNRKLRQQLDVAAFTSGDHVEFSGIYEPKALTKGAKVQLVAKLADGKTKRTTVKLSTEVDSNPEILNSFEGTLTLTAAPVGLWLEISTGKSSGKLLLDNLHIVIVPPSPEIELADAPNAPTMPNLIPVPAAPDLRGGAAIGMGQ